MLVKNWMQAPAKTDKCPLSFWMLVGKFLLSLRHRRYGNGHLSIWKRCETINEMIWIDKFIVLYHFKTINLSFLSSKKVQIHSKIVILYNFYCLYGYETINLLSYIVFIYRIIHLCCIVFGHLYWRTDTINLSNYGE